MITGVVNDDFEAVVRLRLRGPNGQQRDVSAIVDTGFNGFLTLPPDVVRPLARPRIARARAGVANGGEEILDICRVAVFWDGKRRLVETTSLSNAPLIGMGLLQGHELLIQVEKGGKVFIRTKKQEDTH